jgi:hypothetical protein
MSLFFNKENLEDITTNGITLNALYNTLKQPSLHGFVGIVLKRLTPDFNKNNYKTI